MTTKKNYKKTIKKKTIKKFMPKKSYPSALFKKPANNICVGLGFPRKMCAKLKYNETIFLNSGSGALSTHYFIANGLYDPNFTTTGHQPMYFDQYMGLYNHYHVIGSKITANFVATEGNTTQLNICLWQNDDTTAGPTSLESMAEQSIAKVYMLSEGIRSAKALSLRWSAKKTFGGSVLSNNELQGTVGSNPQEFSTYALSIQSADKVNSNSCQVMVQIEYVVVFSELKDVNGS